MLYLTRFKKRIEGLGESDLLIVNRKLHEYFEKHPDTEEIDFSL